MRTVVVFQYNYSFPWITPTYLPVVRKEQLSIHFEGIPHKIEFLCTFFGVVPLVRKKTFRGPVLWTTAITSISTHPEATELDLYIHPNKVLVFRSTMNPGVGTLFFSDLLCLVITFVQLLLQFLGRLISKLPDGPRSLYTTVVTASSSPLFKFESC
jgi:hypothetical protein